MILIPEITPSRRDIVVDEVRFYAPLFGLFGSPRWRIRWRLASQSNASAESWLACDTRKGKGVLQGQNFSFLVRWRPDRRRSLLHNSDCLEECSSHLPRLAEWSASR